MDTIFAPITSVAQAGIVVIRISGNKTISCLQSLGYRGVPTHQKISLQRLYDPQGGEKLAREKLDSALIAFFRAPHSFTGEDVAEISIHASPFILQRILRILAMQENCRLAEAGEFSKRAFFNGKLDLTQAEAIPDLINAESAAQHRQALAQLDGKLGKVYESWREELLQTIALLTAAVDFPEEDLPESLVFEVQNRITRLIAAIEGHLKCGSFGLKIKQGLSLAIIGAPNVGKSSLINFLANSEVAIVSDIPGTTRDIVETHLAIAGIAVRISDTAGIRDSQDPIEQEGIRRALQKAKNADLKIYLLDAANPILRPELVDENTILVSNKSDLVQGSTVALEISLLKGLNLDSLLQAIAQKITAMVPQSNLPLVTNERYQIALEKCLIALRDFSLEKEIELAAEDLRIASCELGKITGKIDIENILDFVFANFCIGK